MKNLFACLIAVLGFSIAHSSAEASSFGRKVILDKNPELQAYVNLALTKKLDQITGNDEANHLNEQGDSVYGTTHGSLWSAPYEETAERIFVGPA